MSHVGNSARPSDPVTSSALPWILPVGVAGCFIGHGAFGIITKAAWLPYFAVGGIQAPLAWRLMPWIGTMDVAMGLLALLWPCRALFLWAVAWATWTALCRPLAGESVSELWERAGNYGVPLAFLIAVGWRGALFARIPTHWPMLPAGVRRNLEWSLRLTTVTLLAGHAGCNLLENHSSFSRNLGTFWPNSAEGVIPVAGMFELALAVGVLVRPSVGLLLGVCLWKLATESLFVFAGSPVWEVVERFGSYTCPLALAYLLGCERKRISEASPGGSASAVESAESEFARQN